MKRTLRLLTAVMTLAVLLCSLACLAGCAVRSEPVRWIEFFGTESSLTSFVKEERGVFEQRSEAVESLLWDYHRLYDIYNEYDGIEHNLCYVNAHAAEGPVTVDPRLMELLVYGKEIHELTGGKTNIAMGAVLRLWHDCREQANEKPAEARIPTRDELNEAAEHIDIDDLILDTEAMTVYFADPRMSLDVGAVAKGFAAQRAKELLISMGADSCILDLGGNLCLIGDNVDEPFVIAIRNPDRGAGDYALRLSLADVCCVTSGNYERYFTVDGTKFHHIIDTGTLYPARYFASVSVICDDSALADALSTALFSMSYAEGAALAERAGVEVVWITEDGEITTTEGLSELIIR